MRDRESTRLPLTAAQEGIWTGQQFDPDSPAFNTAEYVEIHGPVDVRLFEAALRRAVAETDAVNVRFGVDEDGRPWQDLADWPQWTLHLRDLSGEPDPVAAAVEWMSADLAAPVDLRTEPPFGQALLRAGAEHFLWYQRVHHIALDGYGLSLVARRVAEIYTALVENREPAEHAFGPLHAVVDADMSYQDSRQYAADRNHWMAKARTGVAPVVLADRSGPLARTVVREHADLDAAAVDALRAVADDAGAMWTDALTAAFAAYLHRMTGTAEVVLALPVMARVGSVSLRVPCMLTNVVPVWLRFGPTTTLVELTGQAAAELREARPHQRYRYEQLRRDLKLVGSERKLFGPSVNIMPFDHRLRFAGHRGVVHNVSAGLVEDLVVHVYDRGEGTGPRIVLDANPNCYDAVELATHLRRFLTFLRRAVAEPTAPVARIDLLVGQERRLLFEQWNDTARELPEMTLPEVFQAQVAATPERTALVAAGGTFDFAELNRRANRLARLLIEHGAAPELYVALLLPRTADAIVALLAVLKAGAGYVPVDPDYPARRVELVLADSEPVVLVTTEALRPAAAGGTTQVVALDAPDTAARLDQLSDRDLTDGERLAPLVPAHPSCLVYTSGSTGTPKGVVIEHQGLVNLFHHHRDEMIRHETTATGREVMRAALSASLSFDTSWEGLLWLFDGHQLHYVDDDRRREPEAMLDYVVENRIDFLDITPTYAGELVAAGLLGEGRHRPAVIALGGEAAGPALWRALRDVPGTATYNLYGPTECTVDTLSCRLADSPDPIVGRPLANTQAYVLDAAGQPVPPGVVGELYLGGRQVARGYHNRPDLTAERFVRDPFGADDARLYRTGDLARWRPDGRLEFLGRSDDQVKIRGFRIEPGEIEAELHEHPDVAQAAVIVREDAPGLPRLVAYVVPTTNRVLPDPATLRRFVAERLPDYMVPPAFVTVDRLPRDTNGKLDRRALPTPDGDAAPGGRAPRDRREIALCERFAELLGRDEVTIDDDFFSLGGHSLLVGRLIAGIRTDFGVSIGIRAVFEAPTVAQLAERLGGGELGGELDVLVPLRRGGDLPPLFCMAPATGLAWCYANLITAIGEDRPVYGLQSPGLTAAAPSPASVSELAADYVRRIREVQPDGPYHLLGWSFGGLAAHEIAVQLQERGDEVAVLALLDSFPIPHAWRSAPSPSEEDYFAETLGEAGTGRAVVDEQHRGRLYRVFLDNSRLGAAHIPGHFAGDVTLFEAVEGKTADWPGPESWWPHIGGEIYVYQVDSTHERMTGPAAAARIGTVLAAPARRENAA
ncbi:MAG: amino acid adenylation domain-containing protein [Actinophytocola sp.]|uniref:amino acid adenylation domain-containing protein n=1 Tax=Actinophytocola sp. TaxID=1872138 RepID=UPI003D6B1992